MKEFVDECLARLAFAANEPNARSVGVTLVVGGFLISGEVISRAEFMKSHDLTAGMEEMIQEADGTVGQQAIEDNFIHLNSARYYVPGELPLPSEEGVLTRIRLDRVSGFHLGVLNTVMPARRRDQNARLDLTAEHEK